MPTELDEKNRIDVYSFDFDRCLFNEAYIKKYNSNDSEKRELLVIHQNSTLINTLVETAKKNLPEKMLLMVGSRRQSPWDDYTNAREYDFNRTRHQITKDSESCFTALKKLETEFQSRLKDTKIQCTIDPYLLSDTYGNRPSGTNFKNPITDSFVRKPPPETDLWVFDKTKLTILYAQMHKIASENPDYKIHYHFYDDEFEKILNTLQVFFTTNPDLIPENATLHLNHYKKQTLKEIASIKGTGIIDKNYKTLIKRMVERATNCDCDHLLGRREIDILRELKTSPLEAFKEERAFRVLLSDIDILLNEMKNISKLKNSIFDLERILLSDIEKNISGEKIKNSDALRVAQATKVLIETLKDLDLGKNKKNEETHKKIREAIKTYEDRCQIPTSHPFAKAIAVVMLTVLGCVIGAAVGAGIGMLAGAWSGPGAAATGVAGLLIGGFKGASFGLALGTTVAGISTGVISRYLFFKPDKISVVSKKVAEEALKLISPSPQQR